MLVVLHPSQALSVMLFLVIYELLNPSRSHWYVAVLHCSACLLTATRCPQSTAYLAWAMVVLKASVKGFTPWGLEEGRIGRVDHRAIGAVYALVLLRQSRATGR